MKTGKALVGTKVRLKTVCSRPDSYGKATIWGKVVEYTPGLAAPYDIHVPSYRCTVGCTRDEFAVPRIRKGGARC